MPIFLAVLLILGAGREAGRGLLPINRDFYEIAAQTGGDFYFWAAGEFASSRLEIPVTDEEVLLAYGTVDGRRTFEVPVEGEACQLILFAGVQRKDLATIVRPDKTVAAHGQPGVTIQTFRHMIIGTIESPAAGVWRLELDGAGTYAVSAHVRPGAGGVQWISAEFVEQRGRPGHEGLFPVENAVRGGEPALCRLHVSENVRNPRLAFFRRDGSLIATASPNSEHEGDLLVRCEVPTEPYRLGLLGLDGDGHPVQRIDRPLREP